MGQHLIVRTFYFQLVRRKLIGNIFITTTMEAINKNIIFSIIFFSSFSLHLGVLRYGSRNPEAGSPPPIPEGWGCRTSSSGQTISEAAAVDHRQITAAEGNF
jgi:hypothetical protein